MAVLRFIIHNYSSYHFEHCEELHPFHEKVKKKQKLGRFFVEFNKKKNKLVLFFNPMKCFILINESCFTRRGFNTSTRDTMLITRYFSFPHDVFLPIKTNLMI